MPRNVLPAFAYWSKAVFQLEQDRIFRRGWHLLCHENDLPMAGDYVGLELAGESLFALRGSDGAIRCFYNVCRHRASRLLRGLEGNCGGDVRCPYHGWTYGHDGSLIGVPRRGTFPDLKLQDIRLPEVEVERCLGFVFIRMGGDEPSVSTILEPVMAELEPFRIADMHPLNELTAVEIPVNWKVAVDNNIEGYHIPLAHPGLQRLFGADYGFRLHPLGLSQAGGPVRERPGMAWSERAYLRLLPEMAHLPVTHQRSWRYVSVFPSLAFDVYPDMIDFFQILPVAVDRSVIRTRAYGLRAPDRRLRAARYLNDRINRQVAAEDVDLVNGVQAGLGSRSYTPGFLSDAEARVLQFHERLRQYLPELDSLDSVAD
jgi:phenylpropionate dioxygenase-like ring-hydroxylating dioxygenase large terminal subunit